MTLLTGHEQVFVGVRNIAETQAGLFVFHTNAYTDYIYALSSCDVLVTDCGSYHEDAMSVNKPVVLLENNAELVETMWLGLTHKVADYRHINLGIMKLLGNSFPVRSEVLYTNQEASALIGDVIEKKITGHRNAWRHVELPRHV